MNRRELLAAGAFAAFAAGMGAPVRANDKIKVGFIYVGPINDGGWTQHHHHSAKEMVEHFGGAVDFVYQENVPEGPDAERAITQMCLGGANIIFTTSFGYMDPTINVAAKFPNVKFEHATGYKQSDNVSVYSARFYEDVRSKAHWQVALPKPTKLAISRLFQFLKLFVALTLPLSTHAK